MKYRIIDGSEKMNLDEVVRLLRMTYWADKRSVEQIRKSMDNSSCYGVYLDDEKSLPVLQESSVIMPRHTTCVMLLLIHPVSIWGLERRWCHIYNHGLSILVFVGY